MVQVRQASGASPTHGLTRRSAAGGPACVRVPVSLAGAAMLQRLAGNRAVASLVIQRKLKPVSGGQYQAPGDATTSYWLVGGSPEYGVAVLSDDGGSTLYFDTDTDDFVDEDAFLVWLDKRRDQLKAALAPPPAPKRKGRSRPVSFQDLVRQEEMKKLAGQVDTMNLNQVLFHLRKFDTALGESENRREMREQHAREQTVAGAEAERQARIKAEVLAQAQAVVTWALTVELPAKDWRSWESYPNQVAPTVATKVGELWKQQAPKVLPDAREVWPRFRMPKYKLGTGLVTGNLELFLIKDEMGAGKVRTEEHVCDLHLPVDTAAKVSA